LVNDDVPAISIADASVVEGTGETRTLRFNVSLSAPSAQPVTYWLRVGSEGSATPNLDMSSNYSPVPFDPGRTRQVVELDVYGDALAEGDESFEMSIIAVHGATLGDGIATGTIIDDDAPSVATAKTGGTALHPTMRAAGASGRGLGLRPGSRAPQARQ
jgi:chitinase